MKVVASVGRRRACGDRQLFVIATTTSALAIADALAGTIPPLYYDTRAGHHRPMPEAGMSTQERASYGLALSGIKECARTRSEALNLAGLNLTRLPEEIGELTWLMNLKLSSNQLTSLPAEIGRLGSLFTLDLTSNQIGSIPSTVKHLRNLSRLYLDRNGLAKVPLEVAKLEALTVLSLSHNRLSTLPPEIRSLQHLRSLYLDHNALDDLPREMLDLLRLDELFLHGNPGLDLPNEILGPVWQSTRDETPAAPPRSILDYYFARALQGPAPMQEVRLLLVGRGRAGKTSLLKALRGEAPNRNEPETPGIAVLPLPLECSRGRVRAHTWDFGGQEFLHGTHQIFLSERCVYVLVLEGRDGNWELETDYWLRFIQSFGGSSPVIVALNKYDAHPFSVDRFRLEEQYPQIVGFVETDAFAGRGIVALRSQLEKAANDMPEVWLGVPRNWHRVKEELTLMPENFLEYDAYRSRCAKHDVKDPGQQDSLAETLHRLGIALNFKDHHRLRHTSILKPAWVTEAIYGLLRYAQKRHCHGVFERSWVSQALPTAQYPMNKHEVVLELMEKFEVAFPLEAPVAAEITRWLIPELLPEAQPTPFAEFRVPGAQRLRFVYPQALPSGLLPRFIVKTHAMSDAHPELRWRSGVVLRWSGCSALIRLDRQQRRTDVAVIGAGTAERQGLFDIIRAHLAALHGKLAVVEEVQVAQEPEKWIPLLDLRAAEQANDRTIKVTMGAGASVGRIDLPVVETLDTVESSAARAAAGPVPERRLRLFVSYAHQNEKELAPFRAHLTLLGQRGYIQTWQDRDLVAGELWEDGIVDQLRKAEIVLLFYTTAARASEFIQNKELPLALDRAEAGECALVWVPLERNDLDPRHQLEKRLSKLECATRNKQSIYDFDPPQVGWMQVERAIQRVVEKCRASP